MTTATGPRRVALISSSYHPHAGGVEEHVRHVARELAAVGHAVVVWTVDRGEHLGTQHVDGIEVRYLPAPLPARSARGLITYAARSPQAWRRWLRAHRDFQPDVLHVQCFGPNGVYALALHYLFTTPLVVSSHGETFADDAAIFDRSALVRQALRRAVGTAAAVTGCSQFVVDHLARDYRATDGIVVPNGVDLDAALGDPLARRRPEEPYLLAVGRLGRMKGFDLLLKGFASSGLADQVRLVIGGDGDESGSLAELAHRLGVSDRVSLPGRLSPAEVADWMEGALAVVVPSRMEAFGIVVLEAWRAGAPLVMTSRGGGPYLVRDGVDALVVDPEDESALAARLGQVWSDEPLRAALADAGLARVQAFTWAAVAADYEAVYSRIGPTSSRIPLRRNPTDAPHVGLNGKWTAQPVTGTQRYAMEVTRRLVEAGDHDLTLHVPRDGVVPSWVPSSTRVLRSRMSGTLFEQVALPLAARRDLLVSLGGPAPLLGRRQVVTMHDAGAFRLASTYSRAFGTWYRTMYRVLSHRANTVLTVSEFSADELTDVLGVPRATFVIAGNGCEHVDALASRRPGLDVELPFVLCVGTFARHKNLPDTLTALDRAGHRVVVVGASGSAHVFEAERVDGWTNVLLAGRLADEELVWLYQHAVALVFPSKYEGFGLPVIEAQRLGCPVVCSDRASLPEVAGDGAAIVDADDPAAFVAAVERLGSDPEHRAAVVEAGRVNAARHTWDRSARIVSDVIRHLPDPIT